MNLTNRSVEFQTIVPTLHEFYHLAHTTKIKREVVLNFLIRLTVGCVLLEECQQVRIVIFLLRLFYLNDLDSSLIATLIIRVLYEVGVHAYT